MLHIPRAYLFLISAVFVSVLSFLVVGPYNMRIDGAIYVSQVEQFDAGQLLLEPFSVALRAFKPLIGIFGSLFTPLLTPIQSIQFINLLFLFAFPFVAFTFYRALTFDVRLATIGAMWTVAAYPVLKYGLAISTDLGGWVIAFGTAAIALIAIERRSVSLLALVSVCGFLGGTFKETGIIGLIFGVLYTLMTFRQRTLRETLQYIVVLSVPALMLELALLLYLFSHGSPSFMEWFSLNNEWNPVSLSDRVIGYTGVFVSTFNVLALYALWGAVSLVRNDHMERVRLLVPLGALFLSTAIIYPWPIFISRIVFIQALFVVPLALIGIHDITERFAYLRKSLYARMLVYVFPVLVAGFLFVLAGTRSLFDLFR